MLAALAWDPEQILFTIPWIERPVAWYGVFFAVGFFLAYAVWRRWCYQALQAANVTSPEKALTFLSDRILWMEMVGVVVGARLGHIFFYDWPLYRDDPTLILKVWEGGLASHGGLLGAIVALLCFHRSIRYRFPLFTFLRLLDSLVVPTAVLAGFIRIGNFFNQEIIGVPTALPWAVQFMHPFTGAAPVPRHPVQLYEAAYYFLHFFVLLVLQNKKFFTACPGRLCGGYLISLFTFRFFIEYLKMPQALGATGSELLTVGQWLSFPVIALGIMLLFAAEKELKW